MDCSKIIAEIQANPNGVRGVTPVGPVGGRLVSMNMSIVSCLGVPLYGDVGAHYMTLGVNTWVRWTTTTADLIMVPNYTTVAWIVMKVKAKDLAGFRPNTEKNIGATVAIVSNAINLPFRHAILT